MSSGDQPSWRDRRILTTLLLVFLAGGALGAVTMRAYVHQRLHHAIAYWKYPDIPVSYDRMKDELQLTPAQCGQLKSILDDMVSYRRDIEAQVFSFQATGKYRIMAILTPGQQKRFEKISKETIGR